MYLPESVTFCIRRLEEAGFEAYAVGGCVRDALLGLTPQDYDLCSNALPAQISQVFADFNQVHNGEKHGTVGIIVDEQVYEITTFRKEGTYSDTRHPDWVEFVSAVEEDLARRDFTVNAMAYHPQRGLIDPFGGQADLKKHILRTVGDPHVRFSEDALRILRGVRFAVRYALTPDHATMDAMEDEAYQMEHLAPERIYSELCKLLPLVNAADLLRFAPVITTAIPELAPCVGFQQHSPHHRFDVFTHIAYVVENSPATLVSRWAALLHDCGKPATFTQDENGRGHFYGHDAAGGRIADAALHRLKAPTKLREQVVFLIEHHMTQWEPDKRLIRRRLGKYGAETVQQLLSLQDADFHSKGVNSDTTNLPQIRELLQEVLTEDACFSLKDLALTGNDLLRAGFSPCPAMGQLLSYLLRQVQDEVLPNEEEALLKEAMQVKNRFFAAE